MKSAFAATLAVVVLGLGLAAHGAGGLRDTAAATGTTGADWTPRTGMPLAEPVQILPDSHGVVSVTLVANAARTIKVAGADLGAVTPFTAGLISAPGTPPPSLDAPTLHVSPGGKIVVTFMNYMNQDTNIHYHGLHVAPDGQSDNIFRTFKAAVGGVPSVNTSIVDVPLNQPVGTYWYHVHRDPQSAQQLMTGLSGLLIVDPIQTANAPLQTNPLPANWQRVETRQLELRDVQTTGGQIKIGGPNGFSTRLLNALYEPTFTMNSNRWELWRLANVGANVYYDVGLSDGRNPVVQDGGKVYTLAHNEFHIVGEDGLPVWRTRVATTLLMPPGKRFDVLVRIPAAGTNYKLLSLPYSQSAKAVKPGTLTPNWVPLVAPGSTLKTTDVLGAITVKHVAGPITPAASLPVSVQPEVDPNATGGFGAAPSDSQNLALLPDSAIAQYRTFHFAFSADGSKGLINGEPFSDDEYPQANPILGTVEEWRLVNDSTGDHPFHIHINGFQVISVDGRPYKADGHEDTVNIPRQYYVKVGVIENGKYVEQEQLVPGEVIIRQRFTDYTGWFVFHCHILAHEDIGMMATIQVRANASVPTTPPPPSVRDGLMDGM